jgi:5-methylcytosine-specific restriction protein A
MPTYLLTWNPKKWHWADLADFIATVRENGEVQTNWSCGITRRIQPGDRVFLLRQGVEPKGIVGAGWAESEPYEDEHWNGDAGGRPARYIDVTFTELFDAETEPILPRSALDDGALANVNWRTQSSGIRIPDEAAAELEVLWSRFTGSRWTPMPDVSEALIPEEVEPGTSYAEGTVVQVLVNRYERDPRARRACIEHYGATCLICSFDFVEKFGEAAGGIIHVHHLVPLSTIGKTYNVDPIRDMIPVCPNCHAVIHSVTPPWTPEQMKELMDEARHREIESVEGDNR